MMFCQKRYDGSPYQNYRIIYIDDHSLDGTAELVEHYVNECNQKHRVTIVKNKTRKRALANLYLALQMCQPDEIVFNMDGDDWLANDTVFALIDSLYTHEDIWITYGSFINWPSNEMGYCQPISDDYFEKQLYRKKWWKPGQLRTFYAWLAQQVQLKDLFFEGPYFQGQFFPANADLAYYYPMMEMAGPHYKYIPDVIYIRNVATPLNDFKANKDVQILGSKLLREKPKYPRLEKAMDTYFTQFQNMKADILVLSENITHAKRLIDSCEKLVSHINTIHIVSEYVPYESLTSNKFAINHVTIKNHDYKTAILNVLEKSDQKHIIMTQDTLIFTKCTDCTECISALEHAFAYNVCLGLGCNSSISHKTGTLQPIPALNQISDSLYAWAFHYAEWGDWRRYNNFGASLYRIWEIKHQMKNISGTNREELLQQWSLSPINLEQVGLCYETPHISYINW
jgi:glycosyltransferase involved in cell wall biosynthesis